MLPVVILVEKGPSSKNKIYFTFLGTWLYLTHFKPDIIAHYFLQILINYNKVKVQDFLITAYQDVSKKILLNIFSGISILKISIKITYLVIE